MTDIIEVTESEPAEPRFRGTMAVLPTNQTLPESRGDVLNEEQMRRHRLRAATKIERRDLNGF